MTSLPSASAAAPRRRSPVQAAGFTILELLVTSVIIGLIFAAGATMIVSHIRQSAVQESVRRLQDEWGRINYFMATEIGEAASAAVVPNTSLTLTLLGGQTITYAFNAATNTLTRTGPPVRSNGRLDLSSSSTVDFLTNITAFTPSTANNREPSYAITLTDGRGNNFIGFSSSARTRISSFP